MQPDFNRLKSQLEGDLFSDNVQRVLYSTDASSYKELPLAVSRPKTKEDIKTIIAFARENGTSVIPRGGGTSLAGQVVGPGIIADISRYMNKILKINTEEKWVLVEPGVVLAELNLALAEYGLQFAPETSTASRCVIGGMLGNNSCGLHSLIYGSVREHVLEVDAILSDGSEVTFKALSKKEFDAKLNDNSNKLEKAIYRNIYSSLSDPGNQKNIREHFPDPDVKRRNNGYAIDVLLDSEIFTPGGGPFNLCKLLAGSEGTLAFSYRIKLNLIPLPPPFKGLMCAHFNSLEEAYRGNLIALKHNPGAIELMDDIVINCTKENAGLQKNRFFIQGDPAALLMIEFARGSEEELDRDAALLEKDFRSTGIGYHFPLIIGEERIKKVWNLRTAGLGVLANVPGDKRAVTVVEDTAVAPKYLSEYMKELGEVFSKHGLECVHYGHIATGELHLRPLLNLKDPKDVKLYHTLASEVAGLAKKYHGSLSGEHGDGRLRGEFIPFMLGENNYRLIRDLKHTWDPDNIFNPGKITDTPPITGNLRIEPGTAAPEVQTVFNFPEDSDFIRLAEKCNGTGDCRKSSKTGGTMCPTFMATRDEDKTTRGRANILRELLIYPTQKDPFAQQEIYDILDLCISCKACKSECPANVDMAKLKAEFLQHYYDVHDIPFRSKLIAYLPELNRLAVMFRPIANMIMKTGLFKTLTGFETKREIPPLSKLTLEKWAANLPALKPENPRGKVYLFNDEFTNFQESSIGIKAILLLTKLGYEVKIPAHRESGRTFLSKGLVRTAQKIAIQNIQLLKDLVSEETPLVGIEPSAILAFRDEYPDLADKGLRADAQKLAGNSLMFDEFICREVEKGNISPYSFTEDKMEILLHGHCQQKAIASTSPTIQMLSIPKNFRVNEIPSGCCGMAGSFGYEKEHYELSMKIGELTLFPAVREAFENTVIAAPGTSCRHQIKDGTGKQAFHPVEILYDALI